MIRKIIAAIIGQLIFACSIVALNDVSVPNTFVDSAVIEASDFNANFDSIEVRIGQLNDSLELKFMRFSDLSSGDSTLTRIQVDTIRSNPNIDSAFIDYLLADSINASGSYSNYFRGSKLYVSDTTNLGSNASASFTKIKGNLYLVNFPDSFELKSADGGYALVNRTSNDNVRFSLFSNDGDGTDTASFRVYSKGYAEDPVTSAEFIEMSISSNGGALIKSATSGSGTARNLAIYTKLNTSQLVLDTNGIVNVQKLKIGGSVIDSAYTNGTSDSLIVRIEGGSEFAIPAR